MELNFVDPGSMELNCFGPGIDGAINVADPNSLSPECLPWVEVVICLR